MMDSRGSDYESLPTMRPFAEQVLDSLRESIRSGKLVKGTRLSESALASRFCVSRAPVRKALASLEKEGLVHRDPGKGIIVIGFAKETGADLADTGPAEENLPHILPFKDAVYIRLREAIITGALPQGTGFSDLDVARQYGISRMPVREAIQKLAAEGLVDRAFTKGFIVAGLSDQDVAHIFSIRKSLEGLAILYAVRNLEAGESERMQTIIDSARASLRIGGPGSLDRFLESTKSFNAIFIDACRVKRLILLVRSQRELLERFQIVRKVLSRRGEKLLDDRQAFLDALRAGNGTRARAIWEEHLDDSMRAYFETVGRDIDFDYVWGSS